MIYLELMLQHSDHCQRVYLDVPSPLAHVVKSLLQWQVVLLGASRVGKNYLVLHSDFVKSAVVLRQQQFHVELYIL